MAITSKDIVSLSHARAKLTEFCEIVRAKGGERLITKYGGTCAALINAERLDYYHRLEREHIPSNCCRKRLTEHRPKKQEDTEPRSTEVATWPVRPVFTENLSTALADNEAFLESEGHAAYQRR